MKYHWGYVVVPFCLLSELVFKEKDATEAEYDEETFNLKDHSFKIAFMIIHSSILLILIY